MTQGVFLYFVPNKSFHQITASDLAGNPVLADPFFELIHSPKALRERLIGGDVLNNGPEGKAGCVISIQPQAPNGQIPRYSPDSQTWRKFGDQWFGWQTDMMPGPESLRRANQIPGYEIELADGRIWNAPAIQRYDDEDVKFRSALPMAWGMNEHCQAIAVPVEHYRAAWEMSAKIVAAICGGAETKAIDAFEWAVKSLSLNYRVGAVECSILGLLTDDTISQILNAAIDLMKLDFVEKKPGATHPT